MENGVKEISARCKSQVRGTTVCSISDSKVYMYFVSSWPSCHSIPSKERELGGAMDKIRGVDFRGLCSRIESRHWCKHTHKHS